MIFDITINKDLELVSITEYNNPPSDIEEKKINSEWTNENEDFIKRINAIDKEDALRAMIFYLNVTNNNAANSIAMTTKTIANLINELAKYSIKPEAVEPDISEESEVKEE